MLRDFLRLSSASQMRAQICPGGTIIEGTAGNTGIGLALVGNARGYRTIMGLSLRLEPEARWLGFLSF
jgi:cysteine synthase A